MKPYFTESNVKLAHCSEPFEDANKKRFQSTPNPNTDIQSITKNCKLTLFFLSFLKTETSSCFETMKQQQQSKPSQHDVFINKAMSQKISPVQCLQYLQLQPHKHLLLLKLINTNKATCWTKQKQIYKSQNNKKKIQLPDTTALHQTQKRTTFQ